MEVYGKIWGKTSPIFNKNNVAIHRIEGMRGGFSSKHRHQSKFNLFFVESGSIKITVYKDYGSGILEDVIVLNPGEQTTVAPGEWHQFEVINDCVVLEIYWVELDSCDIERETIGGIETKVS